MVQQPEIHINDISSAPTISSGIMLRSMVDNVHRATQKWNKSANQLQVDIEHRATCRMKCRLGVIYKPSNFYAWLGMIQVPMEYQSNFPENRLLVQMCRGDHIEDHDEDMKHAGTL